MCWFIGEIQIFDTQEKKVQIYYHNQSVIKLTYSYHSLPNLKIKYQTKSFWGIQDKESPYLHYIPYPSPRYKAQALTYPQKKESVCLCFCFAIHSHITITKKKKRMDDDDPKLQQQGGRKITLSSKKELMCKKS